MTAFRAGFGRADITPKLGCRLVGYGSRTEGAKTVHDPLQARALVLEDEGGRWAIVSLELLDVSRESVEAMRQAVQRRVGIPPSHVFIGAIHTHGGPDDREKANWERPLEELVADAVEGATFALRPARLGGGFGFLYGYSINRRWLDRPVDPAVAVVRVDDASGEPLGLVTSFGCHAVVLGPDNLAISADWPGYACRRLEEALGESACCLFFYGGGGDVNPLVEGVRQRLRSGIPVLSIGRISAYYGSADDPRAWNIGDRRGGTFEEVAELGEAFAEEVLRVAQGIQSRVPAHPLWSEQVIVEALDSEEGRSLPAEIMLLHAGEMLLLSQPGEVFSETAVALRARLRALGYATPMVVGCANGSLHAYLPPPKAFEEGGYEPQSALRLGLSHRFQERVWQAVEPLLRQRAASLQD